ncbi:hypothetical protein B0H14DRAFT_2604708 [Mycena olivaceomarginata]|nr:hypothetical protein B0H14DRAFT_2604708 [Mycena olivaceomarginata]
MHTLLNLGQIDAETSGMQDAAHCKIEQAKTLIKTGKGELATAKSWLENAQASDYCLERMADIVRWDSVNFEWLFMHAAVYLAFSKKTLSQLGLYKALRCIGNVLLAHGDEATAESVLIVALDGFTYMDVHRCRADCVLYLGDIAKRQGDLAKAATLWKQSHPLFERSLRAESVAYIDVELADLAT